MGPLTRLAERTLNRICVVLQLLGDAAARCAVRRFQVVIGFLESAIEETLSVREMRLRCVHHGPIIVVLYDVNVDHASGDVRPSLLLLQLLHELDALRREIFLRANVQVR